MELNELTKSLESLKTESDLMALLLELMSERISLDLFVEALKKANLDPNIVNLLNETDKEENDQIKGRKNEN